MNHIKGETSRMLKKQKIRKYLSDKISELETKLRPDLRRSIG
jgi:hypothetical protein